MANPELKIPETSLVLPYNREYELRAYIGETYRWHAPELLELLYPLSEKAFAIPPSDAIREVGGNLAKGASIIIVVHLGKSRDKDKVTNESDLTEEEEDDYKDTIAAYATQGVSLSSRYPRIRSMYTSSRVVAEKHRRKGLAMATLTYAHSLHRADILCGVSGNPGILNMYANAPVIRPGSLHPTQVSYADSPRMLEIMERVVEKAKGRKYKIDPKTGLIKDESGKGPYKDGLEAYDNPTATTEEQTTYTWMEGRGYVQRNGDAFALAVVARGRNNFVGQFTPKPGLRAA